MEKQITIIIPTYNMEAYIGKCLDSLLIPELDQVEVLVVNDGSKDRSSEIAHSYADRYPGSIRVIDKPNGNYGSCINAALPQATGRYVKVLDADDTFDSAEFSRLLQLLPTLDDDVIITPFTIVDSNGTVEKSAGFRKCNILMDKSYNLHYYDGEFDRYRIQMHQILFKTDIFTRFSYHQTEGISYTDAEWATIPFTVVETYRCISPNVTQYLSGREGQTMAPEQIRKFFNNFIVVLKNIVIKYSESPLDNNVSKFLHQQILMIHEYVYFKALSIWRNGAAVQIRDYDKWLQNTSPSIYNAIGEIPYTEFVNFKIFKSIRKNKYSSEYTIPFYVRAKVSLLSRLNTLLKKW